ncbi:hypothetical protein SAMN02745164_00952 [Marinitoga hydrogenitolerans DSM 16785]|uniref:Uncharacterized protein n=1 Tax=Marinitoga hydrogenitolerans (strain DSM 16785 / JCM 12826 / AT1271) TaxID=1122195 RepID=A0A1M4VJ43_MARH1|nr:hypothetical protein [Marinitoga hydrogenitolerans]SHE69031.1 hypothetical protein SAMN02745164_00952 [Marinitoga hydrogenitolerans DSM 16785]
MEEYKFDESKFIKENIENSNIEEKEKFYIKLKKNNSMDKKGWKG